MSTHPQSLVILTIGPVNVLLMSDEAHRIERILKGKPRADIHALNAYDMTDTVYRLSSPYPVYLQYVSESNLIGRDGHAV